MTDWKGWTDGTLLTSRSLVLHSKAIGILQAIVRDVRVHMGRWTVHTNAHRLSLRLCFPRFCEAIAKQKQGSITNLGTTAPQNVVKKSGPCTHGPADGELPKRSGYKCVYLSIIRHRWSGCRQRGSTSAQRPPGEEEQKAVRGAAVVLSAAGVGPG
ncbi:hypothetical protein BC567DRAFT_236082 [Phyllosticta citribraziliensis]